MEELYKKDLNEPDYYSGVVSHPESDILECKVKRALREALLLIKLVDVMNYYLSSSSRTTQIPKGGYHQDFAFIMTASLEVPAVATGLEKVNLHPNSQEG